MSRLSDKDADALRIWFQFTVTMHSEGATDVGLPEAPLGMLVLAFLRLQPGNTARYVDVRTACRLRGKSSLSDAVRPLIDAGFVVSSPSAQDGREKELTLTDQGRNEVGKLLHASIL